MSKVIGFSLHKAFENTFSLKALSSTDGLSNAFSYAQKALSYGLDADTLCFDQAQDVIEMMRPSWMQDLKFLRSKLEQNPRITVKNVKAFLTALASSSEKASRTLQLVKVIIPDIAKRALQLSNPFVLRCNLAYNLLSLSERVIKLDFKNSNAYEVCYKVLKLASALAAVALALIAYYQSMGQLLFLATQVQYLEIGCLTLDFLKEGFCKI